LKFGIEIARAAERHIRDAAAWWAEHRPEAALFFAEDLESALDLIDEFPFAGEVVRHRQGKLRRLLLSRVHYHLYYSIDAEARIVKVLALWHTSRGSKPRF
jgi:plasmid stabilization system protein ParE